MTAATGIRPNLELVREFWAVLAQPGDVREVRIPKPRRPVLEKPLFYGVQVGYFDTIDAVAASVERITGEHAESVYVSLNPVRHELLARANNRLLSSKQAPSAGDADVLGLRNLLIDVDATRVAGISATDGEKQSALQLRDMIHRYLSDVHVWPEPAIIADTGNGGALIYRIDLQIDQAGLLKRVLLALGELFDHSAAHVDTGNHNPSRIVKISGTVAAKGECMPDRPWRLATAAFPGNAACVTIEQLLSVAGREPPPAAAATNGRYAGPTRTWTMDELLSLNHVNGAPRATPYGTVYDLDRCLASDAHNDGACLIEFASGAVAYRCQHNSCAGATWLQLRAQGKILVPGYAALSSSPNGRSHPAAAEPEMEAVRETPASAWPEPLASAAFYGLLGEIARSIEPHTEADPAAVLKNVLAAFGNVVGAGPHWMVGGKRHGLNLYAVLVGDTGKARKGTSWGASAPIFERAARSWATLNITTGLASGEGVIWEVRDKITKLEPVREGKRIVDYQEVTVDPGVKDKRRLIIEEEFGAVLKQMVREGNILSAVLRQAWDSGNLRTMTKNNPARATGAHISIMGHITRDELLRHISDTEAGNGFANRFLWLAVRRSKYLPDGGYVHDDTVDYLAAELERVLETAGHIGMIERDDRAAELWRAIYAQLSDGRPGLLGAITSRAEAQVMRLAAIYAVADESNLITTAHLHAAGAVWEYAEASARFIFGERLGDPIADTIYDALRAAGRLNRTDLMALFGRNVPAARIGLALTMLEDHHRVTRELDKSTGGRPAEFWRVPA